MTLWQKFKNIFKCKQCKYYEQRLAEYEKCNTEIKDILTKDNKRLEDAMISAKIALNNIIH